MTGGAQAQFLVVVLAMFVVPNIMSYLPSVDPLFMIMGLFGFVALLQQLGMSPDGEGHGMSDRGQQRKEEEVAERTSEELLQEAERCLAQNSWEKVQALARQVSDKDPENARAWELLVTALKWEGKREQALAAAEKARDLYEVASPALDKLVKELSTEESPDAMATECETKAEDFLGKRQYDLAAECFQKALDALSKDDGYLEQRLRLLRRKAECAQQLQDWGACRAAATEVLEEDPNDTQALLQRAVSNEALEKYKAALEDARKLLALDPKSRTVANRIVHNCQQALKD